MMVLAMFHLKFANSVLKSLPSKSGCLIRSMTLLTKAVSNNLLTTSVMKLPKSALWSISIPKLTKKSFIFSKRKIELSLSYLNARKNGSLLAELTATKKAKITGIKLLFKTA